MLDALQRLFFFLFIFGIFAFLSWATWDTDNVLLILLTLAAGLIVHRALKKEVQWVLDRWKEIEETDDQ